MVQRLFLAVPRGFLRFVIVVFPDHTHLLFHISLDDVRILQLATLRFEAKLQKRNRMGETIFNIFIWGGISSDLRPEITFYGSARASS